MNLEDHPTVRRLSSDVNGREDQPPAERMLDGAWLRRLALDCGADDAGLVDAADEAGVFIDNACRSGTCGSCRVKLISGSVRMAVKDALTEQDKADGYILACQAKIRGDVKVDA